MPVPSLPGELYETIFSHLEVDRDSDESTRALARCGQTSSFVRSVSTLSHLWRPHYECRYTISDPVKETERYVETEGSVARMYGMRRTQDRSAVQLLHVIIARKSGRFTSGQTMAYDLGLDVYDALQLQTKISWPSPLLQVSPKPGVSELVGITRDWLSRPYWAREAAGLITRLEAIRGWKKLVQYPDYVSLAEGISYFSGFRGVSPTKVMEDVRALCDRCVRDLVESGVTLEADAPGYDVVRVSRAICDWMRSQGFDRAPDEEYHRMENHFLDCVLTTTKQTLPLSFTTVFVALARHAGLDAHPVSFPRHVHAVVRRLSSTDDFIHLDVYNSQSKFIMTLPELQSLLTMFGVHATDREQYLRPARTSEMCMRAAQNIQHSYQTQAEHNHHHHHHGARHAYMRECMHAAMTAMVVLGGIGTRVAASLTLHIARYVEESHRLDWCLLSRELVPAVRGQLLADPGWRQVTEMLERMWRGEEEHEDAAVKRREEDLPLSVDGVHVLHHVGTIMRHKKFGYYGVIVEWNSKCGQPESWIIQMGVDKLPRGRGQPFYTVAANDGSIRYVAEENVDTEKLPANAWTTIRDLLDTAPMMEVYFDRAEVGKNGVGRFIAGADLRRVFPGDVILCQRALEEEVQELA